MHRCLDMYIYVLSVLVLSAMYMAVQFVLVSSSALATGSGAEVPRFLPCLRKGVVNSAKIHRLMGKRQEQNAL